MNAVCMGCGLAAVPSPSSVTTFWPTTPATGVMHERIALPFMCTVHAPHCARPQPKRGPCSSSSLRAHREAACPPSRHVRCACPLTLMVNLPAMVRGALLCFLAGVGTVGPATGGRQRFLRRGECLAIVGIASEDVAIVTCCNERRSGSAALRGPVSQAETRPPAGVFASTGESSTLPSPRAIDSTRTSIGSPRR